MRTFDSLTREELAAAAPVSTVVLPLGSTEQHGPHLPVRTDAAIVSALARDAVVAAAEQVPVLLAPTLPIGCAHHHLPFGGTLSLRSSTYIELICDVVTGLDRQGFCGVVLLNGHGGNDAPLRVAVDRLVNEQHIGAHVAAASYWDVAADAVAGSGFAAGLTPGHAGHFETSVMLAVDPLLVQLDQRPRDPAERTALGRPDLDGAKIGRPGRWEDSDGRTDDASLASPELGARLLEQMTAAVADFLVRFHRSISSRGVASSSGRAFVEQGAEG